MSVRVGERRIKLEELRGFFEEKGKRFILLKNGEKLEMTMAEQEKIQKRLTRETNRALKDFKKGHI